MRICSAFLFALALSCLLAGCANNPGNTSKDSPESVKNLSQIGNVYLAGQPQPAYFTEAEKNGVETVISLRHETENTGFDEEQVVKDCGMSFINVPFGKSDELTHSVFSEVRQLLKTADHPILLHCGSANRVGAVWLPSRVLDDGVPLEDALAEAKAIGLKSPAYEQQALSYIETMQSEAMDPVDIKQRLELFVDDLLVSSMDGVEFFLHEPVKAPIPDSPLPVIYTTVLKDEEIFRAYYRDIRPGYEGTREDGHKGEITCYAESRDGHEWTFPELGIFDIKSEQGNNVILDGVSRTSHNFSPFIDKRPGLQKEARYKALAGVHQGGGLYAFQSEDGIHWSMIQEKPVLQHKEFSFDSQNVSFWSVVENCYVCYFRSWETSHGELRTISRTTSRDFLNWTEPVAMNPNLTGEHLYTSQTHPYFRAPHIYLATPTRFFPDRGESTDILFMATRAASESYTRLFTEAFIRPGLDPERWGNRSNYVALNVVPTGPAEMSIYHRDGHRYTLRTDGFVSVRAGAEKGDLTTKPILFSGNKLVVNYSTSGAGSLRVEILDAHGLPVPGFTLESCPTIFGDKIEGTVIWENAPPLSSLQGEPIRLRFVMQECNLYSFQFK